MDCNSNEYQVLVLKEGYCSEVVNGNFKACGSITLVLGPHIVLVDTGGPWDREELIKALQCHKLTPENIEYVVVTHGHSDHCGNINLFPQAIHIVSFDICQRDEYVVHDFKSGIPYEIDDSIEVIPTPGHTGQDVSVVVRNTDCGTVVIAGDLFEHEHDLEDPDLWKANSLHPDLQEQNRIEVLSLADYIVPGHGPMFQVPEDLKRNFKVVLTP